MSDTQKPACRFPMRFPRDKSFYKEIIDFEGTVPLSVSKVLGSTQAQNYATLINSSKGNKMVAKVELCVPEGSRDNNNIQVKVKVYSKEGFEVEPVFEVEKVDQSTQMYAPKKLPQPVPKAEVDAVNIGVSGKASQEMSEFACPMCNLVYSSYVSMYKHLQNSHLNIQSHKVNRVAQSPATDMKSAVEPYPRMASTQSEPKLHKRIMNHKIKSSHWFRSKPPKLEQYSEKPQKSKEIKLHTVQGHENSPIQLHELLTNKGNITSEIQCSSATVEMTADETAQVIQTNVIPGQVGENIGHKVIIIPSTSNQQSQ